MNFNPYRRIRQGVVATLTGVLALPVMWAVAPVTAHAAACTRTVSGFHSGVLDVAANQKLCLVNAVQYGAVNVAPNGALSVTGSTITGAVTLKAGSTDLRFCGSRTVQGAISATGAKGPVVIGDGAACLANSIGGAVTLSANKAGVTLARNTVAGAVTASSNLGGTTISGNRIGGGLTCASNVPAPTNAGLKNTVGGGRSGQTCAASTF